ncbi:histidine phosphatase family protein [Sphingomonas adhaesiva]|uniref:histidine phosphatase family protein n=1 Tax=Sphingomonas adhaesiva TaxID=28212 RepID=UPI002FFAE502
MGRVLSGRSDIALDAMGMGQATALAQRWRSVDPVAIHASPRRRTQQTARPLADRLGQRVLIEPALDEVDFGAFTGRTFAALEDDPDWRHWNAARDVARCPGGETMAEAVARAVAFVAARPPGVSLCVTHCDVIRGVVAHYLGLDLTRIFQLGCDPGSITTLELEGEGACLVALNERG